MSKESISNDGMSMVANDVSSSIRMIKYKKSKAVCVCVCVGGCGCAHMNNVYQLSMVMLKCNLACVGEE
jgi:hypothetical protein